MQAHRISNTEHILYTAGDVEVHRGHDGALYMLDMGRCFPPESPLACERSEHLQRRGNPVFYRKLRPEFLKYLKQKEFDIFPLSPDGLTGWRGYDDGLEHDKQIFKATLILLNERIQELSCNMSMRPEGTLKVVDLATEFHKMGVNMRHLAIVACFSQSTAVKRRLLEDIILRTLKNLLREVMRNSKSREYGVRQSFSIHHLNVSIARFLNIVTQAAVLPQIHELSMLFWCSEGTLELEAIDRYGLKVKELTEEISMLDCFRQSSSRILIGVLNGVGIRLVQSTFNFLKTNSANEFHFVPADIADFVSIKRRLSLVDESLGTLLIMYSQRNLLNEVSRRRIKRLGLENLQNALRKDPYDSLVCEVIASNVVSSLSQDMEQEKIEAECLNAISALSNSENNDSIIASILHQMMDLLISVGSTKLTNNFSIILIAVLATNRTELVVPCLKYCLTILKNSSEHLDYKAKVSLGQLFRRCFETFHENEILQCEVILFLWYQLVLVDPREFKYLGGSLIHLHNDFIEDPDLTEPCRYLIGAIGHCLVENETDSNLFWTFMIQNSTNPGSWFSFFMEISVHCPVNLLWIPQFPGIQISDLLLIARRENNIQRFLIAVFPETMSGIMTFDLSLKRLIIFHAFLCFYNDMDFSVEDDFTLLETVGHLCDMNYFFYRPIILCLPDLHNLLSKVTEQVMSLSFLERNDLQGIDAIRDTVLSTCRTTKELRLETLKVHEIRAGSLKLFKELLVLSIRGSSIHSISNSPFSFSRNLEHL